MQDNKLTIDFLKILIKIAQYQDLCNNHLKLVLIDLEELLDKLIDLRMQ